MSVLKIIFEDQDLMVVDKPSGLTVNRSDTTKGEKTLQDLIEEEGKIDRNSSDQEFLDRSGIVHRLDKETSGVLIVAKNSESFHSLQSQFKERKVGKRYIALAHGKVMSEGEISVPVGRLPWNRKRFGVLAGGREAKTFYKVKGYYENPKTKEILSLLELEPKTGRTHQIRVHLKYINHPIFGDYLYSGRKTSRDDRKELERVFLHAFEISFDHPKTSERLTFDSPLPQDLLGLLDKLELNPNN